MKITNPTVFLKDGELFCLTVEVPVQPNEKDYLRRRAPGFNDFIRAESDYVKDLASAKSSAVKVKNREEVEKVMWEILYKDNNKHELNREGGQVLYTLTGYEADGWFDNNLIEYVTITPIQKEESQEELIWEFIDAFEKLKNSPKLAVPELQKRFTITRKLNQ